VAAQAAGLCAAAGHDVRGLEFTRALQAASGSVRRGFAAFALTLSTRPDQK